MKALLQSGVRQKKSKLEREYYRPKPVLEMYKLLILIQNAVAETLTAPSHLD